MDYNFDRIISRHKTGSLKFDGAVSRGKPSDILPLWVADMDFPAPDCVLEALQERISHGIFGYSEPDSIYFDALAGWFTHRFGYEFDPDWVTLVPGVVYAICTAISAYTKPGDGILIQEPVYHPFRESILANNRRPIVNELRLTKDSYVIDFADFERKIIENDVKLFLLCNPHNPIGRVWQADELREMVRICVKYNVLIIADEIHCDFVFPGHTHLCLPALLPEEKSKIILLTAPSKSFNLAGLQISNVFISDFTLRREFRRTNTKNGYSQANQLGIAACRAAYLGGADWLDALVTYIGGNMAFLDRFLKDNLPKVRLTPPQGTYLAWLDCRDIGLTPDELDHELVHTAGLWLSRGDTFGSSGAGFTRINTACPRTVLETCMKRFCATFGEKIEI